MPEPSGFLFRVVGAPLRNRNQLWEERAATSATLNGSSVNIAIARTFIDAVRLDGFGSEVVDARPCTALTCPLTFAFAQPLVLLPFKRSIVCCRFRINFVLFRSAVDYIISPRKAAGISSVQYF